MQGREPAQNCNCAFSIRRLACATAMPLRAAMCGQAAMVMACALMCLTPSALRAGTILKLSLGEVGPDIGMNGGVLSTVNDGNAATTGDQNTAVDFTDGLNFVP